MLTFIGTVFAIFGCILLVVGLAESHDNKKAQAISSIIVGTLLIAASLCTLYYNYTMVYNKKPYIKIVRSEFVDTLYTCKDMPFTDSDRCTAIKERVKCIVSYKPVNNPQWKSLDNKDGT